MERKAYAIPSAPARKTKVPKLPPPPLPLPPLPPPPPSSLVLEAAGLASGCSFLGAAAASSLTASSFCLLNFERFDVDGSAATTAAAAAGASSVGGTAAVSTASGGGGGLALAAAAAAGLAAGQAASLYGTWQAALAGFG